MNGPELSRDSEMVQGKDKVLKYNWRAARGHGELVSLPKGAINVDERYQRSVNNAKCLTIARDFNWIAFGALAVARRPDGSLWAIDGQHRLLAARKRSDIAAVPCVVYELDDLTAEATGFLAINTSRGAVTSVDTHRAMVVSGDSEAAHIEAIAAANGFEVKGTGGANTIKCVKTCRTLHRLYPEAFDVMFPLATQICRGRVLDERIVTSLTYLHHVTDGRSAHPRYTQSLLSMGAAGIREATDRAAAYYAKGGAKVWASGLLERLNKGRKTQRLTIAGAGDAAVAVPDEQESAA